MTPTQVHDSDGHLTGIRRFKGKIVAQCPEHGAIGHIQPDTQQGRNAVITEARGHDDLVHGVFRSLGGWTVAFASRWEG